jgi:hypothetical protein
MWQTRWHPKYRTNLNLYIIVWETIAEMVRPGTFGEKLLLEQRGKKQTLPPSSETLPPSSETLPQNPGTLPPSDETLPRVADKPTSTEPTKLETTSSEPTAGDLAATWPQVEGVLKELGLHPTTAKRIVSTRSACEPIEAFQSRLARLCRVAQARENRDKLTSPLGALADWLEHEREPPAGLTVPETIFERVIRENRELAEREARLRRDQWSQQRTLVVEKLKEWRAAGTVESDLLARVTGYFGSFIAECCQRFGLIPVGDRDSAPDRQLSH